MGVVAESSRIPLQTKKGAEEVDGEADEEEEGGRGGMRWNEEE